MTEADWQACSDPQKMLQWLLDHRAGSERKVRLFLCAACSPRIWASLNKPCYRDVIAVAEKYADGLVPKRELAVAREAAWNVKPPWHEEREMRLADTALAEAVALVADESARGAAVEVVERIAEAAWQRATEYPKRAWADMCRVAADLLRHVMGSPWEPLQARESPSIAVSLAQAMYEGQDCGFALHDALLETGHAEIAAHFQKNEWHPKGCWALDLLLGKS